MEHSPIVYFPRVFTAIAYGAMVIGETLVLAPEYSKAKSGAAHLFALLEKNPTINSYSQEGKKPVSSTTIFREGAAW